MPTLPSSIRAVALLIAAAATAQTPPIQTPTPAPRKPRPTQPPYNPNVIFLDPAHGGSDPGAHLADEALEKDATLAFAKLLRTLLTPRGFTVILTHESAAIPTPPPTPQPDEDGNTPPATPFNPAANNPSLDTRTEQANRSRAVACLILHTSNGGHGVHLYTSSLTPAPPPDPSVDPALRPLTPWDSAQATSVAQSANLASTLATALNGIRLPLVTARASIRPIDSLTCPAVAVELSPLTSGDSPADPAYQGRVAQALAAALEIWRSQAQAQIAAQQAAQAAAAAQPSTSGQPPTSAPKPKPKSRPIPQENPLSTEPQHPPAPIIRPNPPPPLGATP